MALIVTGDNKERLKALSGSDDEIPSALRLLLLLLLLFPFCCCCSLCKVSSIPTYCNPFWRNEISAPGGIDFSAFLMLDRPNIDSYAKVKDE